MTGKCGFEHSDRIKGEPDHAASPLLQELNEPELMKHASAVWSAATGEKDGRKD